MPFRLSSTAFAHNGPIPRIFTCEGRDFSPPLAWSGMPEDTRSLALVIDDPDAPDPAAPQMTWVHWIVYNIPPEMSVLSEGASQSLPRGLRQGLNDWKKTAYGGPCPPVGRHRYFHKLYALDISLDDLPEAPTRDELEKAMQGHVLDQAVLVGTYQKA